MKKFMKIAGIVLGVLVVIIIGGIVYINVALPAVEAPKKIKVEATVARIERGRYIAHHVAVCMDCHSERDMTLFAAPVKPGTEGKGGMVIDEEGMPGRVTIKNITPAAIGKWTDGELIRAIACGVDKDGEPLFPMMPYNNYNKMSKEDMYSLVSYIRTLKPIENKVEKSTFDFPLNLIVRTMPIKTYEPAKEVDKSNPVQYGKYLVTLASCMFCHSQSDQGTPKPGLEFAGGVEFPMPESGTVRSANITPDRETGIGTWTKEHFIRRFKDMDLSITPARPVKQGEFNTAMPWTMYSGMTEEDLGAIYDYLKTIKPVRNSVNRFTPAKNTASAKN